MKVEVREQAQRFYLATDRWEPVTGHEIKVGKYQFCAIPLSETINISEVTTGAKLLDLPIDIRVAIATATKEGAMEFFQGVGKRLIKIIERHDFDKEIEKYRQISIDRLGEMPPIENVDIDV